MSTGTTYQRIKGLDGPSFPSGQKADNSVRITDNVTAADNIDDQLKAGADNMLKKARNLSAMMSNSSVIEAPGRGLSAEQKAELAKTKTYFEYFAELMGVRLFKKYSPAGGSVWNKRHIRPGTRYDLNETINDAWDYTRSHVQNILVYYFLFAMVAIFFPDAYNPTYLFRAWLLFTIYEFYLLMVHHYNRTLANRILAVLQEESDDSLPSGCLHSYPACLRNKKTEDDPLVGTPFIVEDLRDSSFMLPSLDLNTDVRRQPIYTLMGRENRYHVANFISKDEAIAFGKELHERYKPQEILDWFVKPPVRHALNEMRKRTDTSGNK